MSCPARRLKAGAIGLGAVLAFGVLFASVASAQPVVEIVMPEEGAEFDTNEFTIVYRVTNAPSHGFDASIYVQYPDLTSAFAYCVIGCAPIAGDPRFSHEIVSAYCWCSDPGMCYSRLEVKRPHRGNQLQQNRIHVSVRHSEMSRTELGDPWPSGEWRGRVLVGGPAVGAAELWFTVRK